MKEKIAITLEKDILESLDSLVNGWIAKNRSQLIESFLRERFENEKIVHAYIFAHDIKWDHGDYNFSVPKTLLSINKKPVLFYQIKQMSQGGVRKITIIIAENTTWLYSELILWYFPHLEINFVEVPSSYKTGEALLSSLLKNDNSKYLLITNGDTYFPDFSVKDLIDYHINNNSDWTFVLKYVRTNLEKFWNVTIEWNKVSEFIEKPTSTNLFRYLTNCGWYMVTAEFFQSLSYNGEYLEADLFPKLPKMGNILAYTHSGPWFHIQSHAEYEQANEYK